MKAKPVMYPDLVTHLSCKQKKQFFQKYRKRLFFVCFHYWSNLRGEQKNKQTWMIWDHKTISILIFVQFWAYKQGNFNRSASYFFLTYFRFKLLFILITKTWFKKSFYNLQYAIKKKSLFWAKIYPWKA